MTDIATPEIDTEATRHLPLHPLDLRILLALVEGARHGYDIVKSIEAHDRAGKQIYPANLYRRLRDLRSKSLVEAAESPSKASDGRRQYFRLSVLGRSVAELEAVRLRDLLDEVRKKHLLVEPERAT